MASMNKKIVGGGLVILGFLLSPLSWWNDIFINIPLAYAFGFLFSLFSQNLFLPMTIVGYWLTNVLGFILLHRGIKNFVSPLTGEKEKMGNLKKDFVVSMIYTFLVILLIYLGWLKPPLEYFK